MLKNINIIKYKLQIIISVLNTTIVTTQKVSGSAGMSYYVKAPDSQ